MYQPTARVPSGVPQSSLWVPWMAVEAPCFYPDDRETIVPTIYTGVAGTVVELFMKIPICTSESN